MAAKRVSRGRGSASISGMRLQLHAPPVRPHLMLVVGGNVREGNTNSMTVARIRRTTNSKVTAGLRLALALLFLMTGAMKLLVPMLADAWSGQLMAARIPLYPIARWGVPLLEIALGLALGVGFLVRLAGVVAVGIMLVATICSSRGRRPFIVPAPAACTSRTAHCDCGIRNLSVARGWSVES